MNEAQKFVAGLAREGALRSPNRRYIRLMEYYHGKQYARDLVKAFREYGVQVRW